MVVLAGFELVKKDVLQFDANKLKRNDVYSLVEIKVFVVISFETTFIIMQIFFIFLERVKIYAYLLRGSHL